MRTTDKKRFVELGRQLRAARDAIELPEDDENEEFNTHVLASRLGRPQPWISEVENGLRYLDVFDFVRWCRALEFEEGDAYSLLEEIVDDPELTMDVAPKAPIGRPQPGAKRRRRRKPLP